MHTSVNGKRDSAGIQRAHGRRHPRLLPIRNQSPERYRLYASVGGAHLMRFLVDECTGPAAASWLRDQTQVSAGELCPTRSQMNMKQKRK